MKNSGKQSSKKIKAENQDELISFFNNELSETTNRFTPNNLKVKLSQTGFSVAKEKPKQE